MSKTLTGNMETKLGAQFGTEPIIVLKFKWPSGDRYYADKNLSLSSITIQGRILQLDSLNISRYQDSYGTIGSFNVVLSDVDRALYDYMNTTMLEGTIVEVYQYCETLVLSDLLLLFIGKVSSPIIWAENEHTLSCSVVSNQENGDVGMVLPNVEDWIEPDDVTYPNYNLEGQFVPIVFGNCLNTPTLRISSPKGKILETVHVIESPADHTANTSGVLWFDLEPSVSSPSVRVDGGRDFPQNTELLVSIGTILFKGQFGIFDEDTFTFSEWNAVIDLANANTYREAGDVDENNYKVVWIETTQDLMFKHVLFKREVTSGVFEYYINFCIKQKGEKFYFKRPFQSQTSGEFILLSGAKAQQAAGVVKPEWNALEPNFISSNWHIVPGNTFKIYTPDIYICNYIANSTIKGVFAYRTIKIYTSDLTNMDALQTQKEVCSLHELCTVPSSYYTKDLTFNLNGKETTALIFHKALSLYENEDWDDEIFVVQSSPIGPSTPDIIEWILTQFTNITIDAASFAAVETKLARYPSSFAVLSQDKAIELCQKIAWQARCALTIYNNIAYLKYLSEAPTSAMTLQKDKILNDSVQITFSETESILTKIKGEYIVRYDEEKPRTIVYENNIDKFGLHDAVWQFSIYNVKEYALKSLNFWGNYYSNSWKKVQLSTFLKTLKLDLFDCLLLDFAATYPNGIASVRALVENWSYESDTALVNMMLWMAIKAGTVVEDTTFWPSDVDGLVAIDLTEGYVELDYVPPIHVDPVASQATTSIGIVEDEPTTDEFDVTGYGDGFDSPPTENFNNATALLDDEDIAVGDKVEIKTFKNTTKIKKLSSASAGGGIVVTCCATGHVSSKSDFLYADGILTVEGDKVLLPFQTDPADRGIYTVHSGTWTLYKALSGSLLYQPIFVALGLALGRTVFQVTSDNVAQWCATAYAAAAAALTGHSGYSYGGATVVDGELALDASTGLYIVGPTWQLLVGVGNMYSGSVVGVARGTYAKQMFIKTGAALEIPASVTARYS